MEVNENLKNFEEIYSRFDAAIIIQIDDAQQVFEWRAQAEREMREKTGRGMTEDQLNFFINKFMPSYKAFLPSLYEGASKLAKSVLVVK